MTAPKWQAGKLYLPGDIVQPVKTTATTVTAIPNAGFESGDVSWTKNGITIVNEAGSYAGGWHAKSVYAGGATTAITMASRVPVTPGQSVTADCMLRAFGASDQVGGQVRIAWVNATGGTISTVPGNEVNVINGQAWKKSIATGVAPAGAVEMFLQADVFNLHTNGVVLIDAFSWNYTPPASTSGLIYKAVQAKAGTSGASEPTWPSTVGVQVIDNEVTWEAINATRVVWEASSVLKTGATEPVWPTEIGGFVSDGTVSWEAVRRRIEDKNCPNSKVVAILSSKVFAANGDIVRFCATANPLDWTSEHDAGYLPTGLQQANANDMAVLNQYRSNLVAFNASSFQNWQVDPDPSAMAILDQMDGIGSTWQQAAQPVGNELFYLTQLGVRTVGIAGASTNLQAGDVGAPIDPLVQAAIAASVANAGIPRATYYPGAGQYWLAFPDPPQES